MKKTLIILGLVTLGLAGCQQFKEGEGGLLYKIHTDEPGENIKAGDFVALKVIQKTEGDSVIFSSYDYDRVSPLLVEQSKVRGDINYALTQLSEGDSATFKINIDSATVVNKTAEPVVKGKYMVYTVKIVKVIPKGNLSDSIFQSKANEYFRADMEQARIAEAGKIKNYIASKNLKTVETASGLRYVITKQGTGPKAVLGDTVQLNYTGSMVSGKVFDTSLPDVAKKSLPADGGRVYEPIKMPTGVNASIPGFEEALLLLPKGTKATVIMPSNIAYGPQGGPGLPGYTPLIFDLDIINILPSKPGSAITQMPPAVGK